MIRTFRKWRHRLRRGHIVTLYVGDQLIATVELKARKRGRGQVAVEHVPTVTVQAENKRLLTKPTG